MNTQKTIFRFTLVLSVIVGIIIPLGHERFFGETVIDVTLPDNWKRMSIQEKLNSLDGLLSKNEILFPVSKIRQLNIRRQFVKMIFNKEDDILRGGCQYRFAFRFHVGWGPLGLLGLVGFVTIWAIYGFSRVVTLLIPSRPLKHFPSPALKRWGESFKFPVFRQSKGLPSVCTTSLDSFALEARPTRPRKPGAVWID